MIPCVEERRSSRSSIPDTRDRFPMFDAPRDPPILDPPIRVAVCVSGGGTTLQNLIDLIRAGSLRAEIVRVVASRPKIEAIPKAKAAGIPVTVAVRAERSLAEFSRSVF